MKIKFLTEDALYMMKDIEHLEINKDKYSDLSNKWLNEMFGNNIFVEFKKEFPDFSLEKPNNEDGNRDLENIKIIYSNMIELTDSQASDERLWAGLCHDKFYDYMQIRWPLSKAKEKEKETKYILKNYFFAHNTRSMMTNALARLWWIGRLTYDETLDNPYELTEYICNDINGKGFPLFGSNFSNNHKLLKNFLLTIKEFENTNDIVLSREQFLEMIKLMNLWGGKIIIDSLSFEQLNFKLNSYMNKQFNCKEKVLA